MKILQVSNFLAKVHGGSAEVPFQISKTLAERGHGVTVFTSDLGLTQDSSSISSVDVHTFHVWFKLAGFNITPGIIKQARQMVKDFDLIHLHNYRTFQNIVVYHYAKKYGIPYIVQAHGSIGTYFQKGILKKLFDILIGQRILQGAAKVLAVTEFETQQYLKMGVNQEKIAIVSHGIDLAEYNQAVEKRGFRKKYNLPDNNKVILYLGRINKIKGLDLLAEAFAGLVETQHDVKLVIAGPDDGYLPALKKIVAKFKLENRVIFTGPLYGQEKLQAYHDADVCILPSSYEIFGITILEAWACGKPVIVTDRCGLADAVKGRAGLVVPYEKIALAQALSELLDNPSLCSEYGRKGRELVEARYNWPKVISQIENIYHEVLTDSKRGA